MLKLITGEEEQEARVTSPACSPKAPGARGCSLRPASLGSLGQQSNSMGEPGQRMVEQAPSPPPCEEPTTPLSHAACTTPSKPRSPLVPRRPPAKQAASNANTGAAAAAAAGPGRRRRGSSFDAGTARQQTNDKCTNHDGSSQVRMHEWNEMSSLLGLSP